MKILFFGDIVGKVGRKAIKEYLPKLVEKYHIDFVIANGENATHGKGLIEKHYYELIDAGVDCITLGNHYLSKRYILNYIDDASCLVRPLNLVSDFGGAGSTLFDVNGIKVRVSNVLGSAFMKEEVSNPYLALKEVIDTNEPSIHIVDFHAEATGEKMAFGYAFDGLVSAVLGTHTHVQTNDARILFKGTGFVTDVGMCGAYNGILGFDRNSVMNKTLFGSEERFFINEDDTPFVCAAIIDVDENTFKCKEIFTVKLVG